MPAKASLPNIIAIVDSNLCIGCGICSTSCPQSVISMRWLPSRYWQPDVDADACSGCSRCMQVCPQSPSCILEYVLAAEKEGVRFGLAGTSCYIAYDKVTERRIRSASGGAVTALLQELLASGCVCGVVGSLPVSTPVGQPHYVTKIFRSADDLENGRSSHYHPLSYDRVLTELAELEGDVAIIGVPCVLRGLKRLPTELQRKLKYRIGLVCSHNVSAAFIDCLAMREGMPEQVPFLLNLRDKVGIPDANNFNNWFASERGEFRRNRFDTAFTEMWRNYFFARECCFYCADFYGVDADVSVKDAWGRLSNDPLGISLLVVRNRELEGRLLQLQGAGRLHLEACDQDEVYHSQSTTAVYKHEEVRDRMVWKKAIRVELLRRTQLRRWKRRWLSPVSREYWRLRLMMNLSNFWFFCFRRVPVKTLLVVASPLRWNPANVFGRMKKAIAWPWHSAIRPALCKGALFVGYLRPRRMADMSRLKVLVSGGYGYGNVGDEAQLAANLQHWSHLAPGCRVTVLTPSPEYTRQAHGEIRTELAPRKSLFGRNGQEYLGSEKIFKKWYFPLSAWYLFNACLVRAGLPMVGLNETQSQLLDELQDSDVLFLSGGGYLTGMTLTRLWDNMLLIRLAYALGVPVVLSGQTIGVFRDSVSRFLARWGLKKASLIYLRDPVDSPKALSAIGLAGNTVVSTFDDALFLEAAPFDSVVDILAASGVDIQRPYLAVNVHYWGQAPAASRVIMAKTAKTLDRIRTETGLQIVFVPMVFSDENAIEEVRSAMTVPGALPKHGYRPELAVALIQNANLCITMKHHPIIFAMATAVPTVSMAFDDYYHHKNYGAMKIFQQEDYLVRGTPNTLDEQLYGVTMQVFSERDELSARISEIVEELKPKAAAAISRFIDCEMVDQGRRG